MLCLDRHGVHKYNQLIMLRKTRDGEVDINIILQIGVKEEILIIIDKIS